MDHVFIVTHVHEFEGGHEDVKMIGVFSIREKAEVAVSWEMFAQILGKIERLRLVPDSGLLWSARWTPELSCTPGEAPDPIKRRASCR